MAIIDELEVGRWVKAKVEATTGLTAYLDLIPEGAALPAIRFTFQVRRDARLTDGVIPLTRFLVLAVVVADNDVTDLPTIRGHAANIDLGLHKASGTVGQCLAVSARANPFSMTESDGGRMYRHVGGQYEVWAAHT